MTIDQLKRRGFSLANRCYFHGEDEENICSSPYSLPYNLGTMVFTIGSLRSCMGHLIASKGSYHNLE